MASKKMFPISSPNTFISTLFIQIITNVVFTTFSAFSLEAVTLYERGDVGQAAAYVAISVVGSVAALMLGLWLARTVWA